MATAKTDEKEEDKNLLSRLGRIGTMTVKGRELADIMERTKLDILCVQET